MEGCMNCRRHLRFPIVSVSKDEWVGQWVSTGEGAARRHGVWEWDVSEGDWWEA